MSELGETIYCLDHGQVTLVDYMGSDLAVAQAARISNGAAMPEWRDVKDEKLIKYLGSHEHYTPFEHVVFKFYIKAPIFVAREWMRHRTLSYNERSGRYKEFEDEYYSPRYWRAQDPKNKQGSIHLPQVNEDVSSASLIYEQVVAQAWKTYHDLINVGVAREMARMVLPVSTYTEFYATGNLRNWAHFLGLRMSYDAQYEIRQYAEAIGHLIQPFVPISYEALMIPTAVGWAVPDRPPDAPPAPVET